MSLKERNVALISSDSDGNVCIDHPVTKLEQIEDLGAATFDTLGLVKIGTNLSIKDDGTISVPTATSTNLGSVRIGSNITNSSGTISLTESNVTSALGTLPIANGGTGATTAIEAVTNLSISTAAYHNSVPRGKYLGSSVTDAQSTAITNGTFEDLFVGDYWTIGGVDWLIADFDYYYKTGKTECTKHHVAIIPRTRLYTAQMNTSNTTTGAYVGSAMYTNNLATAKNTISSAFGSHVLTIRQYFQNAATSGYETGGTWYDATVWLMNESNVYGGRHFGNCIQGTNWAHLSVIDNRQYAYFRYFPINEERYLYWLRDVASSAYFCYVGGYGNCDASCASYSYGVRPAFCIQ